MATMTLMVNAGYMPLSLMPMKEAVARLAMSEWNGDRAFEALISDESRLFRSEYLELPAPLVMRAAECHYGYKELSGKETERVSRRVLFARDRYQCQYCGFIADSGSSLRQLTIDHVKPVHLFENKVDANTWENVVTACRSCNQRKGGRLPMECGMMPRTTPKRPHYVQLRFAGRLNPAQRDYICDYFGWNPSEVVL